MFAVVLTLFAFVAGSVLVYFLMDVPRRNYQQKLSELDQRENRLVDIDQSLVERDQNLSRLEAKIRRQSESLVAERFVFQESCKKFDEQIINYDILSQENKLLKIELRMASLHNSKISYDIEEQSNEIRKTQQLINDLGRKHLEESREWAARTLNQSNFALCRERLQKAIGKVRAIGFKVSEDEESALIEKLREEHNAVLRSAAAREEQARIQAKIREEKLREKEVLDEIEKAQREKKLIEEALERALKQAQGQHQDEVDKLREQLLVAEAKSQRAISQAQLTKAGYVYVISNIGSFGENVYKIGMTRRLTPQDRVDELGDASVPFAFDVHMMISCTDAPSLETRLHQIFHRNRVNRVNTRKEFFRISLDSIVAAVTANHGTVEYFAQPEALEYRASLQTTDSELDRQPVDETIDEELEEVLNEVAKA